jgi:putative SOS response-associated peptidase YedK
MPVILSKDQERLWLDGDVVGAAALLPILKAYPADEMNYKSGMGPHSF